MPRRSCRSCEGEGAWTGGRRRWTGIERGAGRTRARARGKRTPHASGKPFNDNELAFVLAGRSRQVLHTLRQLRPPPRAHGAGARPVYLCAMIAQAFDPADRAAWDAVLAASPSATLFHSLDFLAYHGDRFRDQERHVVFRDGDTLVGILPLAIREQDGRRIARSPYGASVGGPVFTARQRHRDATASTAALLELMRAWEVDTLQFALPPTEWSTWPDATPRLALLEAGFVTVERDIHSMVPLGSGGGRLPVSSRVTRAAKRATSRGATLHRDVGVDTFWPVLDATFQKHGTAPTHTRSELEWLHRELAGRIRFHVAMIDGVASAGVGEFDVAPGVAQSFYLAHDPALQDAQSLTWLVADAIEHAAQAGNRWYDFGTSSVGQQARTNIFEFKESFGAIGVFRERLEWNRPA